MAVTKTKFINYMRCPRVCALDGVHEKKLDYIETLEEYRQEELEEMVQELVGDMYQEDETGKIEDLLLTKNAQLEVMLPYYKKIELLAGAYLDQLFGPSIYSGDTLHQESFDALFHGIRYLCYVDIYTPLKDTFYITEVKATTTKKFLSLGEKGKSIFKRGVDQIYYLKEELNVIDIDEKKYQKQRSKLFNRYDCCGHYVYDLAVQRYIIEQDLKQHPSSFDSHKIRYFLAVLNSDYIFDGTYQDGQPYYPEEEVIALFDFTKLTDEYMEIIERDRNRIEQFLMEPDVSCFPLGEYCERKKTTKCPYTKICYEKVPEHNSVFDYLGSHYGFQNNGIKYSCFDFLNQGIYAMQDVDIRYLNRKANQIQRNVLDTGVPYVDIPKIQDGIRQIQYPIYHLDFETFPCPLPRFPGERCYSQSVFQFSLHVEREPFVCDKENDHYEFLAVDEKDHREELVEKLCSYISSKKGTILVYNSSFEKSRLRELGIIFPKYQKQLEQMCDMIFDLLYVVKTNGAFYQALGYEEERSKLFNYYHPNLYGSFSIKKVLPLFTTLTYDGMEVSNGTDALVTYASFSKMSSSMYQYKYQKLLEYCKQDTWAMVEILWGLKRFVA